MIDLVDSYFTGGLMESCRLTGDTIESYLITGPFLTSLELPSFALGLAMVPFRFSLSYSGT